MIPALYLRQSPRRLRFPIHNQSTLFPLTMVPLLPSTSIPISVGASLQAVWTRRSKSGTCRMRRQRVWRGGSGKSVSQRVEISDWCAPSFRLGGLGYSRCCLTGKGLYRALVAGSRHPIDTSRCRIQGEYSGMGRGFQSWRPKSLRRAIKTVWAGVR